MVVSFLLLMISCDKETILSATQIPNEIETYLITPFPEHNIIQFSKDVEGLTKTYQVILDGNISLEFNRQKRIIEIDGTDKLPDSVIPEKIRNYVADHFPNNFITDWELEGKHQQVGLDNDLDLEFTMDGDFIR